MRYDCKVQCPKCSNVFKVEMDTTSSSIVNHSYPTKCPNCTKKIMVKVGDANRFCDLPESKASGFEMGKRLTSLPGPYQPTGSAKDKDDTAFQIHPHPYKHKPAQTQTNRSFTFDKPTRARNGLKIAFILLILVFILGVAHGANSLVQRTEQPINSELDESTTVDIQGKVIDFQSGTPIGNCKVTILKTGQSTTTSVDGQYFIPNVKAGVYDVKAEAEGYKKIIKTVTVDPELLGSVNFEMRSGVGEQNIDQSVVMEEKVKQSVNYIGLLIILFSCFALVSAFLIRRRNLFGLCMISAFISILSIGAFVGTFLGIIALILIMMSRTEFDKGISTNSTHIRNY